MPMQQNGEMTRPHETPAEIPRQRRRILILIFNEVAFEGRVVRAASALARRFDVEVLGWVRPERDTPETLARVAALPFRVRLVRLKWATRLPKNLPGYYARFAELFARFLWEGCRRKHWAVCAHGLDCLPSAYAIARLRRSLLLWDAYELYPDQTSGFMDRTNLRGRIALRLHQFLMRACDEIIACNQERAQIMYEEYGARYLPRVIRNVPQTRPDMPRADGLRSWVTRQNPAARRIIVHTGGLLPRAAAAFPALGRLDPDVVLVGVGYWTDAIERQVADLAKQHNLGKRVLLHPAVPNSEMSTFLHEADVGLVAYPNTSRNNYYCAPTKLYEYALAGLAAVAVDFPPCRSHLEQYPYGRCYKPDDPDDLAAQFRACLQENELQRMRQEARRAAVEVNWEHEQERLIAIVEELARCGSRRRRTAGGQSATAP